MVAAIITYAHDKRRFNLTKTNLEYDGYDGTFLDLYKHNDLTQLTAPEIVKEFFHDTGKCSIEARYETRTLNSHYDFRH